MTTEGTDSSRGEKVGFAGLGTMGSAMAANLARAGFELKVWNRTPGKAESLQALGALEVASPREFAAGLGGRDLRDRFAPARRSPLRSRRPGGGTPSWIAPDRLLDDSPKPRGSSWAVFPNRASPCWMPQFRGGPRRGGRDAHHHGGRGSCRSGTGAQCASCDGANDHPPWADRAGQIAKAVNQVILCGTYLAVAEGNVLAMKAGVDTEALLEALGGGRGACGY